MTTIVLLFTLTLAQSVLAQPVSLPAPRQHPALAEFDMSGLDDMRARVQAVINRPADLSPDKVAAFDKTRRAAQAGDTVAQLDLAQMLHGGEGTPRDVDAGLAWMRKSAEGGYGPAQAFLGVAYTLGQGMDIDRKLGEYWSRKVWNWPISPWPCTSKISTAVRKNRRMRCTGSNTMPKTALFTPAMKSATA